MALKTNVTSAAEQLIRDNSEHIQLIPVDKMYEYKRHAFRIRDDEAMRELTDSIREHGVLNPCIVRRDPDDNFEIVAGHRRWTGSKKAGLPAVPCIVRALTDEQADILMADSNLQRPKILPSERAWAYRIKLEAIKRQGQRSDPTSDPLGPKLTAAEKVAADGKESATQIKRYIRLTYLARPLLDWVDAEGLAIRPAEYLSYLPENRQLRVYDIAKELKLKTISANDADFLRDLYREKDALTDSEIYTVLTPQKAAKKEKTPPTPSVDLKSDPIEPSPAPVKELSPIDRVKRMIDDVQAVLDDVADERDRQSLCVIHGELLKVQAHLAKGGASE